MLAYTLLRAASGTRSRALREFTMTEFPLLFTTRELIAGNGFVALVEGCGHALLVREDAGEWWLYGAQPGGIGEGGASLSEANLRFVAGVKGVLSEIAEEAASFDDFKLRVEGFFAQVDNVDRGRWDAARAALKAGAKVDDPWVSALKKEPALKTCGVQVSRIDAPNTQARPEMNGSADNRIALADAA
jgi:hypothetical protein